MANNDVTVIILAKGTIMKKWIIKAWCPASLAEGITDEFDNKEDAVIKLHEYLKSDSLLDYYIAEKEDKNEKVEN